MVGTSEGVAQKVAEVAKENFEKLGFKVRMRLVTQDAMYTKFCNVPKRGYPRLPERRLVQGLLRPADDAQPDVQRQEHPAGEQRPTGPSSMCPRSTSA